MGPWRPLAPFFVTEESWAQSLSLCIHFFALVFTHLLNKHWLITCPPVLGRHHPCPTLRSSATKPRQLLHCGPHSGLYCCGLCSTLLTVPVLTKVEWGIRGKTGNYQKEERGQSYQKRQVSLGYEIHPEQKVWIASALLFKHEHMRLTENFIFAIS